MTLDPDTCWRALRGRDRRFDGVFFVAVRTTGIYCRPICPSRPARRDRVEFFARPAEAERAGYRACFRCRPELAPGDAAVDAVPRLARAAAARIGAGYLNERSVDDLAAALGVTGRNLRRALEAGLGVGPVELAQTRRLAMAKQLLHDTDLPLGEVALAAGFSSLRRFNALFQARLGRPPSAVRRERARGTADVPGAVTLRLDYRPPLDWRRLLAFVGARAVPGVEAVEGDVYRRTVRLDGLTGAVAVAVAPDPDRPALRVTASPSLLPRITELAARLRAQLDLDARPDVVEEHLAQDPLLAPRVAARPGLRVPGAFDAHEVAIRAVLGQQVSVRGATTLAARLVAAFGEPLDGATPPLGRLFPGAARLAGARVEEVRGLGMPEARARTIVELSRALAEGRVDLSAGADPERAVAALVALPGVGPWTAQYLAMRALRWPDAFPAGDLGVRRALGLDAVRDVEARARGWSPWRAYAVMHLWCE